jgi:hypothetical protein
MAVIAERVRHLLVSRLSRYVALAVSEKFVVASLFSLPISMCANGVVIIDHGTTLSYTVLAKSIPIIMFVAMMY